MWISDASARRAKERIRCTSAVVATATLRTRVSRDARPASLLHLPQCTIPVRPQIQRLLQARPRLREAQLRLAPPQLIPRQRRLGKIPHRPIKVLYRRRIPPAPAQHATRLQVDKIRRTARQRPRLAHAILRQAAPAPHQHLRPPQPHPPRQLLLRHRVIRVRHCLLRLLIPRTRNRLLRQQLRMLRKHLQRLVRPDLRLRVLAQFDQHHYLARPCLEHRPVLPCCPRIVSRAPTPVAVEPFESSASAVKIRRIAMGSCPSGFSFDDRSVSSNSRLEKRFIQLPDKASAQSAHRINTFASMSSSGTTQRARMVSVL